LVGDLFRERGVQAATNVDLGQFFMLTPVVRLEFSDLAINVGMLGVRLGVHRNVLSGSHRHRARDQTGDAGNQYVTAYPMRGRDPQHKTGRGKDAVIGTEHGRA